jgi:hypothetical protein
VNGLAGWAVAHQDGRIDKGAGAVREEEVPSLSSVVWRTRHIVEASRLSATARSVRRERLTYLSPSRLRRLEKELKAVLKRVPGDIAEFGVALGGSAIILSKEASRHRRRFHGFDVFAMIPPPKSEKDDQKARDRYRTISSGESKGIDGDLYYGYRDVFTMKSAVPSRNTASPSTARRSACIRVCSRILSRRQG